MAACALNVTTADGAVAAVERALAAPAALSPSRRKVAAELFYEAGTATARCVAALYEVIGLPLHPSPTDRTTANAQIPTPREPIGHRELGIGG
jgi:hypothetical protein